MQFGFQISQAVLLDATVNVDECELPQIGNQMVALLFQLGDGVFAHRPFHFFESQPEALLLGFDGIPAYVFEALFESFSKRRRTGLDKRSKVRFRIFPYMPRTFDKSGIADPRAGSIGGWFLIGERITEVALPYGNPVGPCPVMERLAEFVDGQLFYSQEYERIKIFRYVAGADRPPAGSVIALLSPGAREPQAGKSGQGVVEHRVAQVQQDRIRLRAEHGSAFRCIQKERGVKDDGGERTDRRTLPLQPKGVVY